MSVEQHHRPLEDAPKPPRRTWRRRVAGCAIVAMAVSHGLWLRAFGEYLAGDDPKTRADVAVVLSGDHRLQRAAELLEDRTVSEIWLLEREANYAVAAGILPSTDAVEVEQLSAMSLPRERIRVLAGGMRDVDDAARMIARAVRASPDTSLLVLCERVDCRNLRLVLQKVMAGTDADQIAIVGLPADVYNERNWWKSRTGWKDTFNATCQLLFTMVRGVDAERASPHWNPQDYERQFVSLYGQSGCQGSE